MSIRVVFLGTGSGKPMPHRNVSSVGVLWEGDLYLFDCGEATQIQLAKSNLRPGALKGVFLTHLHGDHVNGLPGFLGSLTLDQRDKSVDIYGPVGIQKWYDCLCDLRILAPGYPIYLHEMRQEGVVARKDQFEVKVAELDHRGIDAWGYALEEYDRPGRFDVAEAKKLGVPEGPLFGKLQDGESVQLDDGRTVEPTDVLGPPRPGAKFVYCTDTVPCEGAEKLAEDADLLVHEATYPAGEEARAHRRGHSTVRDAARCAKKAGAKKLAVTHISQKYSNLEEFVEPARAIFPNTVAARDMMEIPLERPD